MDPKRIFRTVRLYLRATRMVFDAQPALAGSLTLLTILSAASAPLQVWVSKVVIDHIGRIAGPGDVNWQTLILPVSLYVLIWAISQVVQSAAFTFRQVLSDRVGYHTERQLLQKVAQLDIAFYDNSRFHDQMSLARDQIWRLQAIAMQIPEIAFQIITLGSMLLLIGSVGWALPIILIVFALPQAVAHSYFTKKKAELFLQNVPAMRMKDYIAQLLSERDIAKEVRLFQLRDHLLGRFRQASTSYFDGLAQVAIAQGKGHVVWSSLSLAATVGIWIYTGLQALARQISLGDVALIFQAIERSRSALDQIAFFGGYLVEHTIFLGAFFEFLDLTPDAVEGALQRVDLRQGAAAHVPTLGRTTIEFRNVTFCYPGSDRTAVRNISFTLHPGEKVALVGENGAGKTTLVKLLARLYDPTEGAILLSGQDLREIAPEEYYRQVTVIFQDFVRYELTVRENIAFGNVLAREDKARLEQAAEKGGATRLINDLPQQYDTLLGRRFEGSIDISGGEWQAMALSRAFMRDAALLILDEPTAALDAYAETEVYRRFSTLTKGKTTLFVTHRLSSVRMVDKILVLKDGDLIEAGTHDDLMRQRGEYARMFTLQAERYVLRPGNAGSTMPPAGAAPIGAPTIGIVE